MDLKEKITKLPSCPGIYLMKDSLENIIYVGKSKNLKNRVSSYFYNSASHSPKVIKLVKNLKDFDYIVTDTEFEAFMLECKLIKELKPSYNRLMKSPSSYCYVKITSSIRNAAIQLSPEYDANDGNVYFGPYTNANKVERGIDAIKTCCKILCSNKTSKSSACLNFSLGLCVGVCLDSFPEDAYSTIINRIVNFLKGTDLSIAKEIEANMITAAENLDFEVAAKLRDHLDAVNYLASKSIIVKHRNENKNVILLEPLDGEYMKLFLIRESRILFSDKYLIKSLNSIIAILKDNIFLYFNKEIMENSSEISKETIDESQIIFSYIKSNLNNCRYAFIDDEWLNSNDNIKIENALKSLLSEA